MTRGWWRRLAPLARPQAPRLAGLAGLAVVGVALEALLPWPLALVLDHVLAGRDLPAPWQWLAALPGSGTRAGLLAWLAGGVLLVFLAVQGVQLARAVVQADVAARLRLALGAEVFERLQSMSLAWHGRARAGDLVRRVVQDAGCLPALATDLLLPLATATLSLAVLFAVMWRLDPLLAGVAASVAVPMALLMRVLGPRMTEHAYAHQAAEGTVWSVAEQALTAVPVVQAFGRETHEQARFLGVADRSMRAYLRTLATQLQFKVGVDGCEALGVAAIMTVGGLQVLAGALSVGTLVVFLGYLAALYAPLVAFAYLATTVADAAASARRVVDVLDATERLEETPGAPPLPRPPRGQGAEVTLEGVVFGHASGRPVLRGVDLVLRPGETLALVGASGAGKSTLAALLARLHDPWAGCVRIDGHDLRRFALASVREQVALVLQDPFLLPQSVADNIAYGRPDATRAEIEAAARAARAHGFVERLPQGYDTVLGERGVTLSAGQRQRLAIARALLKDAPVLVLDEPTSALDVATEGEVMEALERLRQGRTTLLIAHRLSTLRRADRIAVLEQGRVVQVGTHDELMASCPSYRALHRPQAAPAAADLECTP